MNRLTTILNGVAVSAALLAGTASAATAWNSARAGNPVIPGYFADPCSRKFGDTYYLYVTPDGWDVGRGPAGVWTSKDYVNWTWQPMNWPKTEFKSAPSVVKFGDKYHRFSSVPCQIHAQAVIDSADVLVSSVAVPHPVAVRYAYCQDPVGCNLYNQEGLPASPFRTDNW